jgi:hypothetical protein
MELVKGLILEQGTTIILPDDRAVPALQAKLGVHMDRLRFLSPWPEFQSYISFKDQSLSGEQSGEYTSKGGLQIKIDFEHAKLLDMNLNKTMRIVNIINIKGIKIITIAGMIITEELKDRFVAAYWVYVGPDVFRLLAKNVKPRDVVRLCGTNQKLRAFCTDDFYKEMLQHHYRQKSKTPGATFRDLAAPSVIRYNIGKDTFDQIRKSKLPPLENDSFVRIFCLDEKMFLLTKNGDVWFKGIGFNGARIDYKTLSSMEYIKLSTLSNIVDIQITHLNSFFLDKFGVLRGCGERISNLRLPGSMHTGGYRIIHLEKMETPFIIIEENVRSFSIYPERTQYFDLSTNMSIRPRLVGVYTNGTSFICKFSAKEEFKFWIDPILHPSRMVNCLVMSRFIVFLDDEGIVWILLPSKPTYSFDDFFATVEDSPNLVRVEGIPIITSIKSNRKEILYLGVDGSVWISKILNQLDRLDTFTAPVQWSHLVNIRAMKIDIIDDLFLFVDMQKRLILLSMDRQTGRVKMKQLTNLPPHIRGFNIFRSSIYFIA